MSCPEFPSLSNCNIAVIGLGYVGLPLAVEFASAKFNFRTGSPVNFNVTGYDINDSRLHDLRCFIDSTNETSSEQLRAAGDIKYTNSINDLISSDVFIVTVPTPIDESNRPDLTALKSASKTIGKVLRLRYDSACSQPSPVVIFESTVYPGLTEEICIPLIESYSQLSINSDFYAGYSPERINPGDKTHRLTSIVKVTSGSDRQSSLFVDCLYGAIISAGTHNAPSIIVAEAAKVIENTQRDLNIALVNELAIIFNKLGIDTNDVLEAAGSKWNFLPFRPGLVGGHCIGVDPYYLTYKAEREGYYPQVVLAGRRINDSMASWVVGQLILQLAQRKHVISGSSILICGLTFKENCPDLRNTKVVDIVKGLRMYGCNVYVLDPLVDPTLAKTYYGIDVVQDLQVNLKYAAVVLAVAHSEFLNYPDSFYSDLLTHDGFIYDLKAALPRSLDATRL